MTNLTLALEEHLFEAGRAYAERHGTTLEMLVRDLLVKTVAKPGEASPLEMFRLMNANPGRSEGARWRRSDLYSA